MTALTQYQRLEATALWRDTPDGQRREVIVSIGDATLVISDLKDQALAHWSLAALVRLNPGERPAIYSPDEDASEVLEFSENEAQMIDAIETLRTAIDKARPHPGRLRWLSGLAISLAIAALALFWLPGAMKRHTVSVVPDIKREEIGEALLGRIERVSGAACDFADARPALAELASQTGTERLVILPAGVRDSMHLPGGIILLNRAIIEDHEEPDVAAGYILAEQIRADMTDPLAALLEGSGLWAAFRLITTGRLSDEILDAYAEALLMNARPPLNDDVLLAGFAQAELRSSPYAYARDITGETVLGLIEADPMAGRDTTPLMRDRDWLLLQSICEG
ncbi:hypothetical protein [Thalassococcus sp. S3]|uniref:hypothetical protein n=1 Tax=Thalassococcus sp. S3 TaxID=2017482 RepID=UPI00102479D5|nr:hypothetical protein [Thalassococcus sp. S3]QBF31047.1 hypothetical protein CFI11_07415 [Thalassococcus sp. S3]